MLRAQASICEPSHRYPVARFHSALKEREKDHRAIVRLLRKPANTLWSQEI